MQLNEAEIERLLREYIFLKTPRGGKTNATIHGYMTAAHAIAEAMKEKMEANFGGRWKVDDLGYHVLTVSSLSKYQDKRIRIAQIAQGGPPDEKDGQPVRVYVVKEE